MWLQTPLAATGAQHMTQVTISLDAIMREHLVPEYLLLDEPSWKRRGQSSNADRSLFFSDIVHHIHGCLTLTLQALC